MSRIERSEMRDERAQRRAKQPKTKKSGKLLPIILLVLVLLVGFGGFYTLGLRPVEPGNTDEVIVDIPSGTGASQIVEILDESGLVKNKFCAKVNSKIGGYNSLQASTYVFNKAMSFPAIMNAINTNDFDYRLKESIEVKDGARLTQVAEAAAEQLGVSEEEILDKWADKKYLHELIKKYWFLTDAILDKDVMYPLEGYLYADTYYISPDNSTIESFTEMCLDRMDEELTPRKDAIKASGFSVHELLTLVSIVTKESMSEDQAGVAGVFMNRLKKDMRLESDVTVCYIFQEDRVDLKQSQIDSDNPYNTRKFKGIPPGPICQVVADAIDATLNPEKHDYLFFIADENGIVRYGKDNEDHNKNIDDYGLVKDNEEEAE